MKIIKNFNGSSFPQNWDSSSNICLEKQVWVNGVLTENPFYLTIDMVLSMEGVTAESVTKSQKWGESYALKISINGVVIHSIDTGLQTSMYAAKCTNSKSVTRHFDVSDGILADIESTWLTDFRKAAKITPYDYLKLQTALCLQPLDGPDYSGGVYKYGTDIMLPLSASFSM